MSPSAVPCIVSRSGIERIVESNLPPNEQASLEASAAALKKAIAELSRQGRTA
jgi:L-lactate dehydrogenase